MHRPSWRTSVRPSSSRRTWANHSLPVTLFRGDGLLGTDMKKASPDDPGEAFSLSHSHRDQRSSEMIPSVSPVPTQPS